MTDRDPYVILGIPRDATDRAVREAYYARARLAHPDLVGSDGLEAMTVLNEAWALLKDRGRRAEYDAVTGRVAKPKANPMHRGAGWEPRAGQPPWTGAAGKPPGSARGRVLDFGIYAGWSLGEIERRDRGYLVWLRDHPEGTPYQAEIAALLKGSATETTGRDGQRSRGDRRR